MASDLCHRERDHQRYYARDDLADKAAIARQRPVHRGRKPCAAGTVATRPSTSLPHEPVVAPQGIDGAGEEEETHRHQDRQDDVGRRRPERPPDQKADGDERNRAPVREAYPADRDGEPVVRAQLGIGVLPHAVRELLDSVSAVSAERAELRARQTEVDRLGRVAGGQRRDVQRVLQALDLGALEEALSRRASHQRG